MRYVPHDYYAYLIIVSVLMRCPLKRGTVEEYSSLSGPRLLIDPTSMFPTPVPELSELGPLCSNVFYSVTQPAALPSSVGSPRLFPATPGRRKQLRPFARAALPAASGCGPHRPRTARIDRPQHVVLYFLSPHPLSSGVGPVPLHSRSVVDENSLTHVSPGQQQRTALQRIGFRSKHVGLSNVTMRPVPVPHPSSGRYRSLVPDITGR
jgi:hypothetical protein